MIDNDRQRSKNKDTPIRFFISVESGEAIRITDKESSYPRVSPDGKFVACGYDDNGKMRLAIIPVEGGEPVKLFDVPKTYNFSGTIHWTQDGKFITYRDWANGIWRQAVEDGEPQRLEGLPEEKIYTFSWSRDGKQLAFTRGKETLDAVLISDFRKN
ncbi:MAG: hypothetical protein ABJA66_11835 [Actinomycetota bacterium]